MHYLPGPRWTSAGSVFSLLSFVSRHFRGSGPSADAPGFHEQKRNTGILSAQASSRFVYLTRTNVSRTNTDASMFSAQASSCFALPDPYEYNTTGSSSDVHQDNARGLMIDPAQKFLVSFSVPPEHREHNVEVATSLGTHLHRTRFSYEPKQYILHRTHTCIAQYKHL